jgi:hypothetical protein
MTIWRMRFACWIFNAKDAHSEYATLTAFILQIWLHERASVLRSTFVDYVFRDTGAWPLLSPCVVNCIGGNTVTGRNPLPSTAIPYLMLLVGFSINSVLHIILLLICLGKHVFVISNIADFVFSTSLAGHHTLY